MATERLQVYKCEKCGNIVTVLHKGGGQLVCCGDPMALYEENAVDAAVEKHVPVIERVDGGFKVTVGSTAHPMAEDHSIEWIELTVGGKTCRQFLNAGEAPEATFRAEGSDAQARAYCNLHGLWKS